MLKILLCALSSFACWLFAVEVEGKKFAPKKNGLILGSVIALLCIFSAFTKWDVILQGCSLTILEIASIFSLCAIPMAISDFQNKQLPWFLTMNFWFWIIYLISAISGFNPLLILLAFLVLTIFFLVVTVKLNIGFADIYTMILMIMLLVSFKSFSMLMAYLIAIAVIGAVLQVIRMRDPVMKIKLKTIPALPLYIGAFPVAMAVLCQYFL